MNIRIATSDDAKELLNIYKYYVENTAITFEYDVPSIEEFSERIDITDSFLGQIERGERSLSVRTLRKVVRYTGVSSDYLLFGKDTNNDTIQKINNILALNSETTSDFIYHIVLCSNDFCNKFSDDIK